MYKLFWTHVKFLTIQMLVWLNKSKINKDLWDFFWNITASWQSVMWERESTHFVHVMMLYCLMCINTFVCRDDVPLLHFQFITYTCNDHNINWPPPQSYPVGSLLSQSYPSTNVLICTHCISNTFLLLICALSEFDFTFTSPWTLCPHNYCSGSAEGRVQHFGKHTCFLPESGARTWLA